jgi:hypothetical protein
MTPNIHKVPKYTWVKWREAGQIVYNDLVDNGVAECCAAKAAVKATKEAIRLDIKRGPLPEKPKKQEKVVEEVKVELPPEEKPNNTPSRRSKAKKAK